MHKNRGRARPGKKEYEESIEEIHHADKLIERIDFIKTRTGLVAKAGLQTPPAVADEGVAVTAYKPLDLAAHILAAAHGRFDFPVAIRAFRDLNRFPAPKVQAVIDQRSIALRASCIDTHAAFRTFISCHLSTFGNSD